MANKNFKNYAIAGNNVSLTYDDINDNVTFDVNVDKYDVGLGNVDNTSDADKPISNAVQVALNLKEGVITAGTTAQYWRGDKTWQTLNKSAVGLGNVDNTSDLNKPISTATQTALDSKASITALYTHISDTNNPHNVTKSQVGLGNVDNTSDVNKPISSAVQTALNAKQAIINLTTIGNSGASTFAANVLNIPTYSLSGLGGQPLNANLTSISALTYASTSFVKMTASGTFALDINTYLTAESDTLASVTGRGNVTTNFITIGGVTTNQSVTASGGVARGNYLNNTLVAAANNDVLVGLDIAPTFTTGAFTGVHQIGLRVNSSIQATVFYASGSLRLSSGSITQPINFYLNLTSQEVGRFFATTGNFLIQYGGTFTDAGYRLDVNGTVRIQNVLTLGSLSADPTGANGMIYYNTTSNTFKVYQGGAWKTITAI